MSSRKPDVLSQPSESARAWLFTVAKNVVIDDRRSARYKRELQIEFVPDRPSPDAIGPAFDKWILSDALRSLSEDHRTANCAAGKGGYAMTTDDNLAEWDGAYVLRALSADERRDYENYLAEAPWLAAAAARRQRRSRRTVVASALATAAALLIAGGVVGATVFPGNRRRRSSRRCSRCNPCRRPG